MRQIDQVYIKEAQSNVKQLWSYDMKPIDPLVEEEEDEDEQLGLQDDKPARKIGIFIKHEDFNENNEDEPVDLEQFKDLSEIEQVFVMDHDFVCIQRQRNEEFEQLYEKGL